MRTKVEPKCCRKQQAWPIQYSYGAERIRPDGLLMRVQIVIGWRCHSCLKKHIFSDEQYERDIDAARREAEEYKRQ